MDQPIHAPKPAAGKSVGIAYLMWFFFGAFGAHRFYAGRTSSGFAMLGLTMASAALSVVVIGLIGFPILLIWWIVDAFLIAGWLKHDPVMAIGPADDSSLPRAA